MKKALITGITGQDGSYLAELLIKKGYQVHGIKRRSSSFNTERVDHLFENNRENFHLHYGDLSDSTNLIKLINSIKPNEIYNLGAQSHVGVSFEIPEYTANIDALGPLRILEAIKFLNMENDVKFYQASSSELYGLVQEIPQNENTPFYPGSPYAVSKLFAYWITVNYRESFNMFACNGILFNHESPRRGETFVTRKITRGLVNVALGFEKVLSLGNLEAKRDWGHAKDYVEMQWLMLQQDKPKDYVISTGEQYSVRDFLNWSANELGIRISYKGEGINEVGIVESIDSEKKYAIKKGDIIVNIDRRYFRPAEVETLLGDSKLAKDELNWTPKISAQELCKEMIEEDLKKILNK